MLEFSSVSKSFWTGTQRKVILDRASFRVKLGTSLKILAPNGTGKTTLINMMAGLEKPDEGTITRICRVFFPLGFTGGINSKLSAMENSRYITRLYGLDPDYVEAFCRWLCRLEEYFDQPVGVYSSGMRSRFTFALMLALDSDIYLIDEGMPASVDLATPSKGKESGKKMRIQLPDTTESSFKLPAQASNSASERNASEIRQIQRDIARRRQRMLTLLFTRLAVFIFLPTFMVGWYFYNLATPMYATNAEIVIQQAQPQGGGAGGLATMFQGTSMATEQDSIAVQSCLASREAMLRLDADHGFKDHFSDPSIDALQRLPQDATNEDAFGVFADHVRISYDPTEGLIRMEVIAPDPQKSYEFSQALIGYAEEQVGQLTSRLRADQMSGAQASYEDAEARRAQALATWLSIQENVRQIDPGSETAARMAQINRLESERQRLDLVLQSRLNVDRPSEVQVESLRAQISNIDDLMSDLRDQLTGGNGDQSSLAARNTELRTAEENYNFQTVMVQQALTQMETARIEANRKVRYLSQSVRPVIPDAAAYPRAFENTILAFFIFSGIYLMISLTASILREQVSS